MNTSPSDPDQNVKNPLRIGICNLNELEERSKAFRIMNQTSNKKRYLLSREEIKFAGQQTILKKSSEIDISIAKLLRRHYPSNHFIKMFQPDEGIVIVSDMKTPQGISFSMDIVTQILNIAGGAYEGFVDRVDSFADFIHLLNNALFPKLVLIGHLSPENLELEKANFIRGRRMDHFIRFLEITHRNHKPESYFPKLKQVDINSNDSKSWGRLILEIIREYTKPYFLEELR